MSLNINPLQVVEVRDPVTLIRNREYAILKGGQQNSWKNYTTTSVSNSSIQFACPPPSPYIFINRKLYCQLPVRIAFNVSNPNGNVLLRSGYDAPRAFPLSSSINTITANINNTAVSINMSDIIHPLLRYNTGRFLKEHDYSLTPCATDCSQNYIDLVGSIRNPLANYGDSVQETVMSRGGFCNYKIVENTASKCVIDMVICEPLFLSPFYFGKQNSTGFIGVQTMDFNITFVSNVGYRMWSHAIGGANAPADITNTNHTFSGFSSLSDAPFSFTGASVPLLLFNYITPQSMEHIPRSLSYPYFSVNRYPTDYPELEIGGIAEIPSQNIQLQSIPRRIYVFARLSNSILNTGAHYTDTYLKINKLVINWNNKNGLLSSASDRDLYLMSIKNHCNMSWTEFNGSTYKNGTFEEMGTIGSVVCVEMGTDIGLENNEAAGMLGTFQLQINATVQNINRTSAIKPTLYIVVVNEGVFNIEDNRAISQIGVLSREDITNSQPHLKDYVSYNTIQRVNGGNFLSGLEHFGQNLYDKVREFAKKAYSVGKKIAPYVKTGLEAAKFIAPLIGLGEDDSGGVLVGGAPVGGKMLKRRHLKNRLKRV